MHRKIKTGIRAPWLALGLWLLAALQGFDAARADTNDAIFCFVQLTDLHFGSANHDRTNARIVDMVNALPMTVACVVVTGDLVSDNLDNPKVLNTATTTLARLRMPVHLLPGNHDLVARRLATTLNVYTNAIGPLCSRAEYGGVVFLMLYSEPLRRHVAVRGYDPLTWLARSLKESGDKPVLVFHHAPGVDDFYDNRLHAGWPPEVRAEWTRLLNTHNVKAEITGHFHRDELHWTGDVPLFVSPALATYWGRQPSFRIYEYRNGRVSYRTCYLDE